MIARRVFGSIFSSQDFEEDAGELVAPTPASLRLLELLIVSTRMLALFPLQLTVREVMRMRFSGSREDQLGLLKRALSAENRQRNDKAYDNLRSACEFLRNDSRVLGLLSTQDVETELLKSMLAASRKHTMYSIDDETED